MFEKIPAPIKGQPPKAAWGAAVASRLNDLCAMAPAHMLLADGPTGTGFAPLPANLRDRHSNAPAPRQFDLRARVESRSNGASNEYRVVVEYYNVCPDAVSFSGYAVSMKPNSGSDDKFGWNVLYESPWSSGLDVSTDYYLNVRITAELDEDKTIASYVAEETFWWISDQAAEHYHQTEGTLAIFVHGYSLGHVIASNGSSKVTQYFDGPLIFLDLKDLGREGGGEGDDGINGTNYPMPFQYYREETTDENGKTQTNYKIVNCKFYWNGELKTLSDFVPPATGTVYLNCTQEAPSGSTPKPEWTFAMATSEAEYPSGGRGRSFRLYDFDSHLVTCDYRTTFLALETPHKTAYAEIGRPQSDPGVGLDATTEDPKIVLKSGSGEEKVRIGVGDLNALAGLSGGNNASFNVLTVHKKDGEEKKYAVLSNEDIDVYESGEAAVEVVGTDGSSAPASKKITFEAEEDSKVTVKVSGDDMGNVTVKIGVYYK